MDRNGVTAITLLVLCLGSASAYGAPAASGPQMDCAGSVRALSLQGYKCSCSGGELSCGGAPSQKSRSNSLSESAQIRSMLVGGIVEGLFSSMLAPQKRNGSVYRALMEQQAATAQAARQAEEWRQAEDARFQAQRDQMLDDFKGVEGGNLSGFKGGGELDFKNLDSDAELMAAAARSPFDTAGVSGASTGDSVAAGRGTPFFGDAMSDAELRLLVDPENDPRVIDLRTAVAHAGANLKEEGATTIPQKADKTRENGEPIIDRPDCVALSRRLGAFVEQRSRFQKTILQAQEQVNQWEATNREALMNAAKDGIEYFTGGLMEAMVNRGKAAERLQAIYTRNAARMAEEGVDILALEAKIRRLQFLSTGGMMADITSQAKDWQVFTKDGVSALLTQLNNSNEEVKEILADPKVGKYFQGESPALNALLDISKLAASSNVLGKWIKRQLPVIGLTEISLKQLYNGAEWATSFYRIAQANGINGRVTESARSLQKHIDDTRLELTECR